MSRRKIVEEELETCRDANTRKKKEIMRLREALELLNKMAQQRYQWKRDSNEDSVGWIKVAEITKAALAENQ
jgi:hypothetical protein